MKRRLKIALKLLSVLLVLLFAFLLFERWRGQISLARFKRELAAKGETLDVHKLIGSPVADADNGAAELLRLKGLIREGKAIPKNYPPSMKLIAPGKAIVGFRENFWVDEKATNSWDEISSDLASNKQVLEDLRAVLARPAFDFKIDHSQGFEMNLAHLTSAKAMCQWFGSACQNALRNGENQTAVEDLLAAVAICRVPENDHVAISELVRIAISSINLGTTWEALQTNVWTDEQLASIQKAWEKNTFATNMILSLRVERADGDAYFERFRKSNDETYKYMFPSWMAVLMGGEGAPSHWWQQEFFRRQIYCRVWKFAWLHQDERFYLSGVQQLIDDNRTGSEKTARQAEQNWFGFAKPPQQNFYNDLRFGMSAQSIANLSLAAVKCSRAETSRSMVLCAIALKRHLLRYGQSASDLNALVPEFLPTVPMDYMDGKPMKYRLNTNGTWLLYSVGDDGRDDGGDPSPATQQTSYGGIWRGKDVLWPSPAAPEEIEAWRKETARN